MSSMASSTTFFAPIHDFTRARRTPTTTLPPLPFIKSSFASSKSTFYHPALSLQPSSNFPRLFTKPKTFSVHARAATEKTIYDFPVKDIGRKDVSLSKFKGKIILIVNVASRWYELCTSQGRYVALYWFDIIELLGAVTLVLKVFFPGLEILAFPCNQFGMQEPGSNEDIKQFACTRYKSEFPNFNKVDVNEPFTTPVYQFLKSSAGGFLGDLIKWNFEKFLVDKNGKVIERYPPTMSPFQIEKDIQMLLAA
ncbi:Phospholipid hydroperoxide glutathione peroxidase, chloroplastic [Glycine soja]